MSKRIRTINYSFGHDLKKIKMFQRRSIDTHGTFIKSYLKPGMRILDCGCSTGHLTQSIAQLIPLGEVIGIDIHEPSLRLAQENVGREGIKNISFQQADALSLPFKDNFFDLVFSSALLCHLPDPIAALKEQLRVLKRGGILATSDGCRQPIIYPSNELLQEAFSFYLQPIQKDGGDLDLGLKLGKLFSELNLHSIQHHLYAGNWDASEISEYMIGTLKTSEYNKNLLAKNKVAQNKINSYVQAWENFSGIKGAIFCFMWGQAVGIKP
ncbi:MAG: hypothetical protein A2298_04725 [Gammaproteobacteria bacterium RIFOXYB2_FULL_38_6]|nr:MAG: hypothetical protein A2298_04725 [Gammaproteobacteria bacterium RIFOXYB2_FULL_38_6]